MKKNREIKFRIFYKPTKEMVYLPDIGICGEYSCLTFSPEEDSKYSGIDELPSSVDWFDKENINSAYEIMQFTGLLDKNGKEIWEKDIVRLFDEKQPVIIKDLEMFFWWYGEGQIQAPECVEVIGNIWETPESLNPKL